MISLKTNAEIKILREGGKILAGILKNTAALVRPGISTAELNKFAEDAIYDIGGEPAFKNFPANSDNPFPAGLCTSCNEEIVHGIPSEKTILEEGDIISLDIGMKYKDLYTDMAVTVAVGEISPELEKLSRITKEALEKGLAEVKVGNTLADIGIAVQKHAEAAGYGVVRDLVGHGVGHDVHEAPQVPNYKTRAAAKILIKPGLVIAIEPMVTMGDYNIDVLNDGWTIVTRDRNYSAHWEHTIAVTEEGSILITDL